MFFEFLCTIFLSIYILNPKMDKYGLNSYFFTFLSSIFYLLLLLLFSFESNIIKIKFE